MTMIGQIQSGRNWSYTCLSIVIVLKRIFLTRRIRLVLEKLCLPRCKICPLGNSPLRKFVFLAGKFRLFENLSPSLENLASWKICVSQLTSLWWRSVLRQSYQMDILPIVFVAAPATIVGRQVSVKALKWNITVSPEDYTTDLQCLDCLSIKV